MINRRAALSRISTIGAMSLLNPTWLSTQTDNSIVIGVEEGPDDYLFTVITDALFDIEGNIHILDGRECCIKKFSSDGEFMLRYGGIGGASFEFRRPTILRTFDDLVLVRDAVKHSITIFDINGSFIDSHRINHIVTTMRDVQFINRDELLFHGYTLNNIDNDINVPLFHTYNHLEDTIVDSFGRHLEPENGREYRRKFGLPRYLRTVIDGECFVQDGEFYFLNKSLPGQLLKYSIGADDPEVVASDPRMDNKVNYFPIEQDEGLVGDIGLKGVDDQLYTLRPLYAISGSISIINGVAYSLIQNKIRADESRPTKTKHPVGEYYIRGLASEGVVYTRSIGPVFEPRIITYEGERHVTESEINTFLTSISTEMKGIFTREYPFPSVLIEAL